MLKIFTDLTKFGIVIFVLLSGIVGYATGFQVEQSFQWQHFLWMLSGLYLLSSGSLALNQVQEYRIDQKMPRTSKRPIASGKITPVAGYVLSISFIVAGIQALSYASVLAAEVGLASVALYNGFYTMWWKRKWIFAAVPGAIPGALPVTIGYAAINPDIFSSESIYLFLIMFLWQMPHFWVLAIKYKEDYRAGGIPVLPAMLGIDKTIFHIGLYTFVYVGVAFAAPWFVQSSWVYLLVVFPFGAKVLQEFYRFQKSHGKNRWIQFFLWLNLSMLAFIAVPVADKWNFLFIHSS